MRRAHLTAAVVGAAGAIALLIGFFVDLKQALYSYLFGFMYALTIVLGSLFLLIIGHATNATWFVPLRRQCERIVGALPFFAVGMAPILIFVDEIYPWTRWHELPHLVQHHVAKKLAWLDVPFFIARSIGYMAVFLAFGELLALWSRQQDVTSHHADAARLRARMVKLSVGGVVVLSLVLTFAAWDWMMSLDPAWYSNLYGVYIFAGGIVSSLGLLGALSVGARKRGILPEEVSSPHYHALGRLQLAFVIFWTYLGWCHVLQQWIANIPAEQLWYLSRWYHGWQWQGLVLVLVHFAIPFFLLLSRPLKRNPGTFVAVSLWLVLVHAVDVHYLILPALHESDYVLHWLDFAALAAFGGLGVLFGSLRGRRLPAMPIHDPLLGRGLAYESQS